MSPNFELAHRIASELVQADTDLNELAKASTYLNQNRNSKDFFDWLDWMASPQVSSALARSKRTPDYYGQIRKSCRVLKEIQDVEVIAQTLAWTVRLMRYYPRAKEVAPEQSVALHPTKPQERKTEGRPAGAAPMAERSQPIATRQLRDLQVGMQLEGTVRQVKPFGVFVDIGVGQDGLVHVSNLAAGYVANIAEVVTPGQRVTVWVLEVEQQSKRIKLTMVRPKQAHQPAPTWAEAATIQVPQNQPVAETPPTKVAEQPIPPPRPEAIQLSSLEQAQQDVWVKGVVRRVENNRITVDLGLADDGTLTFDRLPGKPSDPDSVAARYPAGSTVEARVLGVNKKGRVQLTL